MVYVLSTEENTTQQMKFDATALAAAANRGEVFDVDDSAGLHFNFLYQPHAESGAAETKGGEESDVQGSAFNGAGFAVTVCAEYPAFEEVVSTSTTEPMLEPNQLQYISFQYASKIQVKFSEDSSCAAEDRLVFYRDAECEEEEKSFSGMAQQWEDFVYEGSALVSI